MIAPRCTRLAHGERGGPIDERGLADLRARARQRVQAVLDAVPVPRPWSMNAWVDRLEAWRGREIDLVPVAYRPGQPSGAWQARPDYDLIAYTEHTSPLHQDHIIAHELGHLLCAHSGTCLMSDSEAAELAPDLAPRALSHLLTRVTTGSDEYEAELIAVLLMSAATSDAPAVQPGASGRAADQARRLAALLG
ncbi:ImmA/IrrE family metallo-endopeptidase [Amycolatopsis sp. NEAU-NG30]|uniref:ImmA/IrrE family metallo-endopeptidase n=1 Tax=Amycolatopsis melonis TaxID=3156488 RepID=A0ABV0LUH0_9PSEU